MPAFGNRDSSAVSQGVKMNSFTAVMTSRHSNISHSTDHLLRRMVSHSSVPALALSLFGCLTQSSVSASAGLQKLQSHSLQSESHSIALSKNRAVSERMSEKIRQWVRDE